MTKKTFEMVARILRTTDMPATTRTALAREFVGEFRQVNPRFDAERFERACGVQG